MKRFLRWLFRKLLGGPHFLVLVGAFVLFGARADAQGCFGPGCGGSSSGGTTPATLNDATYCPDLGASDAYVCSMVSAPSSYAAGMLVTLSANTANTGTASVNVNSLGAKTITRSDGSTLATGDITAASPVWLVYDGTNFRMWSQWMRGSTGSGNYVLSNAATLTGDVTYTGNIRLNGIGAGLFMDSSFASLYGSSYLTPDGPMLLTGAVSNSWHINQNAQYGYDFQNACLTGLGTAICTDPTLILHSGVASTTQALSLGHNQTQGVITANGGVLARSLTYASGSDVGLTVQGSLTGNIQNWKNSSNTILSSIDAAGGLVLDKTLTAGGTTGARTINKPQGSVNFAAAATTLVVTNSQAATTSLIFLTPQTADATCTAFSAVRAAGSFTITANAACTAETVIAFLVTN